MTALLTQCPHCQTSFRVTSAQLNAANGLVRCGSCLGVFSAASNEIRIKHPDGYVVEEIEADEGSDEPLVPEQIPPQVDEPPQFDDTPPVENDYRPATWNPVEAMPSHAEPDQPAAGDQFEPVLGNLSLDDLHETDLEQQSDLVSAEQDDPAPDFDDEFAEKGDQPVAEELDEKFEENFEEEGRDEIGAEIADEIVDEVPALAPRQRHFPATEPVAIPTAKRDVHSSLSALDFGDALAPVSGEELDPLDDEPVMLAYQQGLRARVTTALLLVANVLLLLALPLPWLYAHRNELAGHPRFGFLAPTVCRFVTCTAPATSSSTAAMYTQQLLVRSDPRAANALEVSFVFHNDATAPQPFPGLELAFSDVNNKLMANRLFTPQEYLPPELHQLGLMPAQSSVQVQLELADPGSEAVNYKVVLHAQ